MFIELVDSLRCVEPHEDSWLVLATRRVVGRSVVEGTLGCPVCRRTYAIAHGVAYLGAPLDEPLATAPEAAPPSEEAVVRLAAMLGLASTGGLVVLDGAWARYASALIALVPLRLLLLDPPADAVAASAAVEGASPAAEGSVSIVRTAGGRNGGGVPLAAGSARAVALDSDGASQTRVAAAARALAAGGRLVAPASVALPAGVRLLARDEAIWVGERERDAAPVSGGAPVSLRRARRE